MFKPLTYNGSLKENYSELLKQLSALLEGENDAVANMANASALLHQFLSNVNWTGFYLYHPDSEQLILGPFQGLPACVRIPLNRGVCGTAASDKKTIRVGDVHQFPGHIACDARSRSEIVIPLVKNEGLIGVLDIDSPEYNRFSEEDELYLQKFTTLLLNYL